MTGLPDALSALVRASNAIVADAAMPFARLLGTKPVSGVGRRVSLELTRAKQPCDLTPGTRDLSSDVEDDEPLGSARRFGGDFLVLLAADEGGTYGRFFGDASTPRIGLCRRHEHVRRLLAILVANLDPGAEADHTVLGGQVLDRLGGREQCAQLANAPFEQGERVHRIAQVEVLGGIVAASAGVAPSC